MNRLKIMCLLALCLFGTACGTNTELTEAELEAHKQAGTGPHKEAVYDEEDIRKAEEAGATKEAVYAEEEGILGPKDVIIGEIERLLNADQETVHRYFGESDVYIGLDVQDRIAVAKVNFIETAQPIETEQTIETGIQYGIKEKTVHICNIDYDKTKEAIAELTARIKKENPTISEEELNTKVTKEVAVRAQNGEFDIHITMPVEVEYVNGEGKVKLTEQFKAALTGGWYNPTNIQFISEVNESGEVYCPVREQVKEQFNEYQNKIK